jgi:hypothetical protein
MLAASVVAAYVQCRGKQFSNSLSPIGWSYTTVWQLGSPPYAIGFGVNRELRYSDEKKKNDDVRTYTEVYAGSHVINIHGDATSWLLRTGHVVATLGIGLLFWVVTTPRGHMKC